MTSTKSGWLIGAGLLTLACASLGACSPTAPAPAASASPGPTAAASADPPCADDGPRFPISKLCVGRSINYLDPGLRLITEAPAGCDWTMQETSFYDPDVEQVLLFRALKCNGVTTQLERAGGAHSASLDYVASALYPAAAGGDHSPVRIFGDGVRDGRGVIGELSEAIPAAERATCEIQPAGNDHWPEDALVIAPNAAARARLPHDEPIAACGPYGLDEDSQTFWRVFQGYAWFFELGQDTMDIDPASFLLMRKGADGTWAPAP
jgi:hypothetical protein